MSNNIVVNADIMWAQLDTVNDLSGKFQVDLSQLSAGAVSALEAAGVDVKSKDDRGSYVTCKSSRPIKAVTTEGESLEGLKIGNGSKAKAVLSTYEWNFKGKTGRSPSLNKLVITDLVEFEGDNADVNLDDAL